MGKIDLADVAGCAPRIEKAENGEHVARLKVFFRERPDVDFVLGKPCGPSEAAALALGTAAALIVASFFADCR